MENKFIGKKNSCVEHEIYQTLKRVIPSSPCWVVIHSSLINFKFNSSTLKWDFLSAIKKLVGEGYTIFVPSFTFSFTKTGIYNKMATISETGLLADWVFQLNNSSRTAHPIYSHVIVGPDIKEAMTADIRSCFGGNTIFAMFERKNACIVMFGCGWKYCTSFHYFEELFQVPYRYYKKFYFADSSENTEMFVRDIGKKTRNDFSPAVEMLRENSLIETDILNNVLVESCGFSELSSTCSELLNNDNCTFVENRLLLRKLLLDDDEAKKFRLNVGFFGSSNLDLLVHTFNDRCQSLVPSSTIKSVTSEYGQMYSDLFANKLSALSLDYSFLPDRLEDIYQVSSIDLIDQENLEPLERYIDFISRISEINSRNVYVNDFTVSGENINGPIFIKGLQNASDFVAMANRLLRTEIEKHSNIFLIASDVMLAGKRDNDPRLWYHGRIPFSDVASQRMAESFCSFISHDLGRTARLIILDLDNTIWGGVVGEDGLKGIKIGGDFPGNAFKDFQATILKLKDRGIALAVVSKNDSDLALSAINDHPENLIRESDLASHRINWHEKYKNIVNICDDLSLRLLNVLFVDDNPVEREKVKVNLPEVHVLKLPEDPAHYRECLLSHVALGVSNVSSEDFKRSQSYDKRKEFKNAQNSYANINDFYRTLKIEVSIQALSDGNFSRALQLINKTNQFNTTTMRYSHQELESINSSPDKLVRVIGYKDKISSFENIGLFILRKDDKSIIIESLLLSCRILERGIEQAALSWIYDYAKSQAMKTIVGKVVVSPRNTPAQNVYKKNGFRYNKVSSYWNRSLTSKIEAPLWIRLIEER